MEKSSAPLVYLFSFLALFLFGATLVRQPADLYHLVAQENDDEQGRAEVASDDADARDQYERWQQILRYGIESEVIAILPRLANEKVIELSDDARALFGGRFSDALFVAAIRYFQELAPDETIENEIADILSSYELYSEALVLQALYYLNRSLPQLSDVSLTNVRRLAKEENVTIARAAIDAIATHGDKNDAPLIREILDDLDSANGVRGGAILAIGDLGIAEELPYLYNLLEDEEEEIYVRQYAATSIGAISSPESLDVLLPFVTHRNARLRAAVVEALALYDAAKATEALYFALRDANDRVRLAAVRAFHDRALTDEFLGAIVYKAASDPDPVVQREAVLVLAEDTHNKGRAHLREQISDAKISFARRAEVIAQLVIHDYDNSEEAIHAIIAMEMEQSRASFFLREIARRLAIIDAPHAKATYRELLQSKESDVILYALQGVSRNNIFELEGVVYTISTEHEELAVRRQALFILTRWEDK